MLTSSVVGKREDKLKREYVLKYKKMGDLTFSYRK